MAHFQFVVACGVVLFMCIQSGYGLSCYDCNSHNDTRCALSKPELPDDLIKTCPEKTKDGKNYILCRKIKQIIDFEVNGLPPDSRVIRSCGWDDSTYKGRCYQRSGFGGRQEVCACEGENCNGSSLIYASTALIVGLFTLLKITL